jgi:hypothetical protein
MDDLAELKKLLDKKNDKAKKAVATRGELMPLPLTPGRNKRIQKLDREINKLHEQAAAAVDDYRLKHRP